MADHNRHSPPCRCAKCRAIGPLHGPTVPLEATCKQCGQWFSWTRGRGFRGSANQRVVCSTECRDDYSREWSSQRERKGRDRSRRTHARTCIVCGGSFRAPSSLKRYCSPACKSVMFGPSLEDIGPEYGPTTAPPICLDCGADISGHRKRCAECSRRNRIAHLMELYEAAYSTGRVKVAMRWRYELVEWLRERDGDDCALCGDPVDFDVKSGPHGEDHGASIDHIHPRSLGGPNELSNLQLAHWGCNRSKGNRVA